MTDFYGLLNLFINTHKATIDETNDGKNRILSHAKPLSNNYFDTYKNNYDNKTLTADKDKRNYDYKRFELIDKNKLKLEQTEKNVYRQKCKYHYRLK